jgi:hypothetical protein
MMTREMVLEMLAGLGADVDVYERMDGSIRVTVEDFEGFDDDYSEIERELDDEDAVDEVYDRLEDEASEVEGDFYRYFHFDGFTVVWGYASMDI